MGTPRLRLGQLLVDARMITASALDEVLAAQRTDGRRLGTLLVERGLINETQLTQILSHQLSVPWVSLLHIEFSRQLLNLVPGDVADKFCLVPIYVRHLKAHGNTLYVAMDDPSNEDGLRACREHAGIPVRAMIAPPSDIRGAIRVYYGIGQAPPSVPPPASLDGSNKPASSGQTRETPTKREPAAAEAAQAARAAPIAPAAPPPAPPPSEAPKRAEPVEPVAEEALSNAAPPTTKPEPAADLPQIEAVEIPLGAVLDDPENPQAPIPAPRGRAPRMVALTLLDGTTINLPARRGRRTRVDARAAADASSAVDTKPAEAKGADPARTTPTTSEPPSSENPLHGLTARDLVLALRVVANGADASEVLGENVRWEALFSALLSLMLKKHLIADWEFVDELKKQL